MVKSLPEGRGASIINISSVVGLVSTAPIGGAGYAASKAGRHRHHPRAGRPVGTPRHPRQRPGARVVRHRDDRRPVQQREVGRMGPPEHDAGPRRTRGRGRRGAALPRLGRLELRHRDTRSPSTADGPHDDGYSPTPCGPASAHLGRASPARRGAGPRPTGTELLLRVDAAGLCHSDLHLMDAPPVPSLTSCRSPSGTRSPGRWWRPVTKPRPASVAGCRPRHLGLRPVPPVPPRPGELLPRADRAPSAGDRHRRRAGRLHARSLDRDTSSRRGHRPVDGGAAHRRRADCLARPRRAPRPLADAMVVVIGVGGLGHLALQLLGGHDPACLVAVEPRFVGRQLAMKLGADAVVPAAADAAAWPDAMPTQASGADLVLDFVGTEETLARAAPCWRPVVTSSSSAPRAAASTSASRRACNGAGASAPRSGEPAATSRQSSPLRKPGGSRPRPRPTVGRRLDRVRVLAGRSCERTRRRRPAFMTNQPEEAGGAT